MTSPIRIAAPPQSSSVALIPQNFDQALRFAESMARSRMVPQHFQGKPDDCLVIIEQAMRWEMSPYAVMQCASMIHGRPMYEGKLVAAVVNSRGPLFGLTGRLRYRYEGEGAARRVVVSGVLDGKEETIEVELKNAKTSNEHWTKQPDQQLAYFGARVWARRFMPELMLGVYSPEEMQEQDARPAYDGTTIEGRAETVNTTETARAISDGIPSLDQAPAPKKQSVAEWLAALERELDAAQTAATVDAIVARQDVQQALDKLRNGARDRLNGMVNAAIQRTAPSEKGAPLAEPPEGRMET